MPPLPGANAMEMQTGSTAGPEGDIELQAGVVTMPVNLCNLPPFHGIANQVMALTSDPDVDLGQIAKVVEGDPAFAADILFLANSSLFGFPSRMRGLRHAIALLGLERIKALAVTAAMRGFMGERTPLVHQCWQHSVACALICDEFSPIFDFSGDHAYTAGIMHDVGRLGLLKTYRKEMTPILTSLHEDALAVLRAERRALMVDHGLAGAWLVRSWILPRDFADVCEHHHDSPSPHDSALLQAVKIACSVADAIGFHAVSCRRQPTYEEAIAPLTPWLGHKAPPPEEALRESITSRLEAFGG